MVFVMLVLELRLLWRGLLLMPLFLDLGQKPSFHLELLSLSNGGQFAVWCPIR